MMTRWRSLFVTGALLAAFAFLVPAVAQAQAPVAPTSTTASGLTDDTTEWNAIQVTWEWAVGAGTEAEEFEVFYVATTTVPTVVGVDWVKGKTVNADDAETAVSGTFSTKVSGLKAGTMYAFVVRGVDEDDNNGANGPITDPLGQTLVAPVPERVSGVTVESGDAMLKVSWSSTHPTTGDESGLRTVEYHVQYRTTQTADASAGDWTPTSDGGMTVMDTTADIANLMNGTSYDVRVRAENNAGGKGSYSRVTADSRGTPMAAGDDDDDMPADDDDDMPADDDDDMPADDDDGDDDGDDDMAMIGPPTEVMVTAGETMIMVSWNKPDMGAPMVKGYTVEYRLAGGAWSSMNVLMEREATIEGLVNGAAYGVRVMAYGDGDMRGEYSEETMVTTGMATPALPLFGALALGAGLVAAGRARLRRRRALQSGRVRGQLGR